MPSSFSYDVTAQTFTFDNVSNEHWGVWGIAVICLDGGLANSYDAWTLFNIDVIPENQPPEVNQILVTYSDSTEETLDLDTMDADYLQIDTDESITI